MFCYNLKSYTTDNCVSVYMMKNRIENKVYFVVCSYQTFHSTNFLLFREMPLLSLQFPQQYI